MRWAEVPSYGFAAADDGAGDAEQTAVVLMGGAAVSEAVGLRRRGRTVCWRRLLTGASGGEAGVLAVKDWIA